MCGLTGFWSERLGRDEASAVLAAMAATLAHRGPDDEGIWCDDGMGLAHRRLAVIDTSPDGHQPMRSADGRYVLVFNGEIYNFRECRQQLQQEGVDFRGHSDTEVLLAALQAWGPEQTLQRVLGMFALAWWDRQEKSLLLARDRLGEKPLYFGWQQGCFLFASELKALRRHPAWSATIDRQALTLFLRHNDIPAPYTIHAGIYKLMPGCYLQLQRPDLRQASGFSPWPGAAGDGGLAPRQYWSLREQVEEGLLDPVAVPDAEAVTLLDEQLRRAVRRQQVADVPLGAFLSGGVDSSVIVAMMQAESMTPVRTFTIGFEQAMYDEAEHARRVAAHLGSEHHELRVGAGDALAVIPDLATCYDEPFADSSAIPMMLVARLAREQVTVCLSGDGGDELFAGYNRYFWGRSVWRLLAWLPAWSRRLLAAGMTGLSPQAWDSLASRLSGLLGGGRIPARPGDQLHKLAGVLAVRHPDEMYRRLVSQWQQPESVVLAGGEPPTLLTGAQPEPALDDFVARMMYRDTMTYLPDDILCKVDRAAMSVGLETRVPMLDPELVALAWRLPMAQKIRHGEGKWLLRQVLYRYVPRELIERPKMGFGVPVGDWLRGPLREWAEALLDEQRLSQEGFFDAAIVRRCWREHLVGRRNRAYSLWGVLMFQAWLETQKGG